MEVDKSRAALTSGETPLLLCGEKRNLHLALRLQAARRRFPFVHALRRPPSSRAGHLIFFTVF